MATDDVPTIAEDVSSPGRADAFVEGSFRVALMRLASLSTP
jgi:hypothetical protein